MKYFIPRLLNKIGVLAKVNITEDFILNNKLFKIPILKKIGFDNLFITEIWMVQVLDKIKNYKEGVFVDVGVNIGQTLIKLRCVDEKRTYIGFEPNPFCLFYTDELIKSNNFQNTVVIPIGISDKNEVLSLNIYSENDMQDSGASIIENFKDQKIYKKIFVPVFSVQNLNNLFTDIGILKIDVEGAELEVLESFKDLIIKNRPFILMEILPSYNKENLFRTERTSKIISIVTDLEFNIYRIMKNQDQTFNSFIKMKEIPIHSDLSLCEYIFVPQEHTQNFENS